MGISVFRTSKDYVDHITDLEEDNVETLVASSYLASHLFTKSAVLRYFGQELNTNEEVKGIADSLWRRRKIIRTNVKTSKYSEIYEIEAFDNFCNDAMVHKQAPHFRATPNEVKSVLQTILDLMKHFPNYQIGFCQEILPFVFIIKVNCSLTIDVRNNFGYQRIQGLLIDDKQIVADFEKEFHRIWQEPSSICERNQVLQLVESKLAKISQGVNLLKE